MVILSIWFKKKYERIGNKWNNSHFVAARIFAQRAAKNQKKAQEIILDLDKAFVSLLNEFFARYKTFPKRIIFFRDGVSEGQFNKVFVFFVLNFQKIVI